MIKNTENVVIENVEPEDVAKIIELSRKENKEKRDSKEHKDGHHSVHIL